MTDASMADNEPPPGKGSKMGLIIGMVLALVGGGASFAVTSGLVDLGGSGGKEKEMPLSSDHAFIPIEPITIQIGSGGEQRFLRFRAELEVNASRKDIVAGALPRVVDVMNTYLRSLDMSDIEDPSSLLTLRAQMRRRIDLVVGGNVVHDLLVMEFVIN